MAHINGAVGLACHGGGIRILEVNTGDVGGSGNVYFGVADDVVAITVVVGAVDGHHIGVVSGGWVANDIGDHWT